MPEIYNLQHLPNMLWTQHGPQPMTRIAKQELQFARIACIENDSKRQQKAVHFTF